MLADALMYLQAQQAMAQQPDWASLQPELWSSIFAAAGRNVLGWTRWCRLIVQWSTVCRSWQGTLLGPHAHTVWSCVTFSSQHHGLTEQHSKDLNRLAARHAHHASVARVYGQAWAAGELGELLASLPSSLQYLALIDVRTPPEAGLDDILQSLAARIVVWHDVQTFPVPISARELEMTDYFITSLAGDDICARASAAAADQKHAQQLFSCLQHLRALEVLSLSIQLWRLTPADCQRLRDWCPCLQYLILNIVVTEPSLAPAAGSRRHRFTSFWTAASHTSGPCCSESCAKYAWQVWTSHAGTMCSALRRRLSWPELA